ncbi:MAG: hypothetical protein AAF196_06055 [Planctomycetota bacterium]
MIATLTPHDRARLYSKRFPDRPPLASTDDWVTGTWAIGACYRNPNKLYGSYPHGYLERVHAMFPDARSVLHAFSGGLKLGVAQGAAWPFLPEFRSRIEAECGMRPTETDLGGAMELVDLHGPDQGRHPTWQGDLLDMPEEWCGRFDLILADPPYSKGDAEKYDVPMVNRGRVLRHLRKFCQPGGSLVWLDQVWPMHRKDQWKCWGQIGLVRSTNHRVRLVSMFEAVEGES